MNPILRASAFFACALWCTAVAQVPSAPPPAPNDNPLPPGQWPLSVNRFHEITTSMRTMEGAVVEWRAFRSTESVLRIPRLYRGNIRFAPVHGRIFLYDIGAQGQLRPANKPNVLWVRVINDPNARLYLSSNGGPETPVPAAKGYWEVQPTAWHPNQHLCDLSYRLDIGPNAEIECVYANVGWPTDDPWTKSKGGIHFLQDDEGFPPPPFPGYAH